MEETVVMEGELKWLGTVDGDLRVGDGATIRPSEGRNVVVQGNVTFEGGVELDCDFECHSLRSEDGLVRVNGNLNVHGNVDVEEGLYVKGKVKAERIDVGGTFSVGESLEGRDVDVGGSLEVQGDTMAQRIDVGGTFEVKGAMKIDNLDVGGSVGAAGGEVTGKIDVGGRFESSKPLRFDRIDTGGVVTLRGGEGRSIDVGGRLSSKGDLKCDDIDVGGVIDIEGNLTVRRVKAGGFFRVSGDLMFENALELGGVAEVKGALSGTDLELGGSLRTRKALLTGRADIGGRVETDQGLKAESVELDDGARCGGPLVGGMVHAQGSSQLQDVYCSRFVAGDGSRIGKVFAESVELGDACVVDAVTYTKDLKEGDRVVHRQSPQKVDKLPPFPL